MPINIKDGTPLEGESLCLTCVYAHIQRGFRESEEDVFCCYVQFRPVRFKVRECTAFCNRTLPTRYEMGKDRSRHSHVAGPQAHRFSRRGLHGATT